MRRVRWFSNGAASAIATKLDLAAYPGGVVATCETGAEDDDNARFQRDCEAWFGVPIIRLKSEKFEDTWDVWERERFIAGPEGAPCTRALKMAPRLAFQEPGDIHVFGYTADRPDVARAKLFRANWFELQVETPLIDQGLTKAACRALLARAGLREPRTYAEGFPNANCMPCGKATSPNYWALVRLKRPVEFWRMATLARRLGARLTRINGVRIFIDEIPADWPVTEAEAPACDFMCGVVESFLPVHA